MRAYTYEEKCCEVEEIAYRIGHTLRRWGRVQVTHTKEKYLTCRVYLSFYVSIHSLVYPGYVYTQFPKWLDKITNKIDVVLSKIGLYTLIAEYQMWLYRKVYYYHTRHLDPVFIFDRKLDDNMHYLTRAEIFHHADYEGLLMARPFKGNL